MAQFIKLPARPEGASTNATYLVNLDHVVRFVETKNDKGETTVGVRLLSGEYLIAQTTLKQIEAAIPLPVVRP